ncbi:MAG: GIY-YIG nuclease family protein [Burkholderiales bacterium]|nr:MAG: GIY-YIG nuclease family protein [Betaproteobacteria bacterium]TAG28282.1 MAG: GIY-YIG nuclease family protein [Burkholderiales bacterium]TAG49175.1 MAG: GIY-YIG nuclease family protein [Betaproteobacteria bacterium]
MDKQFYVYILTNTRNGTLYTGVTNNLARRVWEHKEGLVEGFTKQHELDTLVWYEIHATAYEAITREKRIKAWKRDWKKRIIEEMNPYWNDLYDSLQT